MDNLGTVNYQIKYQLPLIIHALASRISAEKLAPRLDKLLTRTQASEPWIVSGVYETLEMLGRSFDLKQLLPLFNWTIDAIQYQQSPECNKAVLSLLQIFSGQMTSLQLVPACNLFVDNLQNQQNYLSTNQNISLIPVFINLMSSDQLVLTFYSFFSGLNDTSDNNAQIIKEARMQLRTCIRAMDEKQLLVTLELFRNNIEWIGEDKAYTRLQQNWFCVFDELTKLLDHSLLVPLYHWSVGNLNNENKQV